ncbi:MAG: hypothetical protein IT379_00810 [Deltaproteobacteria bacterium]|nr:hypothetical protein [Deltaproteobacteria bacterium]
MRRLVPFVALVTLALVAVGCPQRRSAAARPEVTRAVERARRLRVLAPDVIAEADRALALARAAVRAEDDEAARDHFERAVVWIDVADAIASEARATDRRLAAESRARDARLRASRAQAERTAIGMEIQRIQVAERARAAIDAARRRADAAEARRSPRAARERTAARIELGRMLLERAETHVAAAESMEAPPAGTREAREALTAAERLAQRLASTESPTAVEAARFRDAAERAADLARALVASGEP